MFRPYKVILRPSNKTDPRAVYVLLHCGIPNAYKFMLQGSHNAVKHKQFLGLSSWRAEDDLIRSKHVALTSTLFYGIRNKNGVLVTDVLYLHGTLTQDRNISRYQP